MVASPVVAPPGYTPLRANRYERKFVVDEMTLPQIAAVVRLHPRLFYEPYPPRFVNNLYLDSADLECYYDNVHGAALRRKVRVRWYGELFGEIARPMLEIKVKEGQVGRKHSHPLAGFACGDGFCDRVLQAAADRSALPEAVRRDLRDLNVVLVNRYHRRYYASRDGQFRVTLDSGLVFYRVNGALGSTFVHRQANARDVIVELKYEIDQEPHADRVAGFFPFRVTRNSKYVQGMERVYL